MKKTLCRPVSLTDARSGKRIRVSQFSPGAALVAVCPPQPILGYWFRQRGALSLLSVYVPGTMPFELRTAAEEGRTHEETWLTLTRGGIQEIDLTDARNAYAVLLPAPTLSLFDTTPDEAQAA